MSVLALLPTASWATSSPEKWAPRCGGPFNLCGFVELKGPDRSIEEERIPKLFEATAGFSDGLAAVRVNGRYGYIDPVGRIVIPARFEAAGPFSGGHAEVWIEGRSGAIDRTGRLVVPAQFDRLVPFAGGAFIARPLRPGAQRSSETVRLDGEVRLEGLSSPFNRGLGGGIYHLSRGWLTPQDLRFSQFDDPARGLIWAGRRNEHGDQEWGLMRADGSWQVTPRYGHVQRISETHAVVGAMPNYSLPARDRKHPPRGAVDRYGNLVVPMAERGLSYWRGGYGYAREPSSGPAKPLAGPRDLLAAGKGLVLPNGDLLAGRYFDDVDFPEDGKLPRGRIGTTWYSIERNGRLVPDQLEGTVYIECSNGLKFVRRGDMFEVQPPGDGKPTGRFERGILRKVDCPGPFAGKRGDKWFMILEDGTVLGEPNGFDSSYSFSGNVAAVKVGDKWGVIDRTGAFRVKPKFRHLRPGAKDKFVVGEGKNVAWIDGTGQWIKAPVFPKPTPTQALNCDGGLRFFNVNGLWGFQDGDGKHVIEPRYRALSCFRQGVSWTASPGETKWCPVGPEGKRREAIPCRTSYYPMIVTHHYPESFSADSHESSVLWTRAWLDFKAGARAEPPKWVSDDEGPASFSVMAN